MGSNYFCIGFISILLIAITASSNATEQLLSRQREHGLVKFEGGQQPARGGRQYGFISFRDQDYLQGSSQPFKFDESQNYQKEHESNIELNNQKDNPISFEEVNAVNFPQDAINGVTADVTFQDDNVIEEQKVQKKRKKKRRRRPRLQRLPAPGVNPGGYPTPGSDFQSPGSALSAPGLYYPNPESGYPTPVSGYPTTLSGYPNPVSGYPTPVSGYPTPVSGYPSPGSGYPIPASGYPSSYNQKPYGNPAFATGFHKPLRRPKPQSVATEALSAVVGALVSIARYDDYQCVPRLLCEAAGGGALGAGNGAGSGLLQSVAALQPLLTLLSAYNGISTSPLFIFGRAVFLGMTSRGNSISAGAPATCRYAYPLCPTDPEQLVHYLNNHNGGFFRFFNAPQQPANPQYGLNQNLEQFYNQLASPGQNPGQYGFYQPAEHLGHSPVQYGLQNGQLSYPAPGAAQGYGLYNGIPTQQYDPNYQQSASNGYQNYGRNYSYSRQNTEFPKVGVKNSESESKVVESNKIEERIQNVKSERFEEENLNSNDVDLNKHSTWHFPNTNYNEDYASSNEHTERENKHFSFPKVNFKKDCSDSSRKAKGFYFPGAQSNRDFNVYAFKETTQNTAFFDSYHHDSQTEAPKDGHEEAVEVVYIVRGDGDPKNPEIVKLSPGQTIQSVLGYRTL